MELLPPAGRGAALAAALNAQIWPGLLPGLPSDMVIAGCGQLPAGAPGGAQVLGAGLPAGATPLDHRALHVHWLRGPLSARLAGGRDMPGLGDAVLLSALPRRAAVLPTDQPLLVVERADELAPGWPETAALLGWRMMDATAEPVATLAAIRTASLVVTEVLQAAMLADAVGVPWVGFAQDAGFPAFEWADWAMALGFAPRIHVLPSPVMRPPEGAWPSEVLSFVADQDLAEAAHRTALAPPAARGSVLDRALELAMWPLTGREALSPLRTAAALVAIATEADVPGQPGRRATARDQMLSRLALLTEMPCFAD